MATYEIVRPSERLAQFGREYHRIQHDHAREAPAGATRRRLQDTMERVAQQFERVLSSWVADDELSAAWRAHLYENAPAPDGPEVAPPRLFKGVTEAGSRIEIVPAADGGHDILIDGARMEHSEVPWHLDPERHSPVRIGSKQYREVFDVPDEALRALERFTTGTPPPRRWVRELFEDGLIDVELALTARGRRALSPAPERAEATGTAQHRFCVVAADGAHARILTLDAANVHDASPTPLVEIADLSNPARRAKDGELFSDSRPGLRRESGQGVRHAVDDRRDSQRQEGDKRFAEMVAAEAEAVWSSHPTCHLVVVAGPRMLGNLRPAIARRRNGTPVDVRELDRELSWMSPAALHDALAGASLLPPRGRRMRRQPGRASTTPR